MSSEKDSGNAGLGVFSQFLLCAIGFDNPISCGISCLTNEGFLRSVSLNLNNIKGIYPIANEDFSKITQVAAYRKRC